MLIRVVRRGLGSDFISKHCSPRYYGKEGYTCVHFREVRDNGNEVVCEKELCPHVGKAYIIRRRPLWKRK